MEKLQDKIWAIGFGLYFRAFSCVGMPRFQISISLRSEYLVHRAVSKIKTRKLWTQASGDDCRLRSTQLPKWSVRAFSPVIGTSLSLSSLKLSQKGSMESTVGTIIPILFFWLFSFCYRLERTRNRALCTDLRYCVCWTNARIWIDFWRHAGRGLNHDKIFIRSSSRGSFCVSLRWGSQRVSGS